MENLAFLQTHTLCELLSQCAGQGRLFASGVLRRNGFNESNSRFFCRRRVVLCTARNDEELAGSKQDRAAIGV